MSARTTDGAAGESAADRLGEADDVGHDAEALGRAARRDGHPRLDLVEDGHRAMAVGGLNEAGEVPLVGEHEADVHHRRLDDHAGDLAGMRENARSRASRSLKPTTIVSATVDAGMPAVIGTEFGDAASPAAATGGSTDTSSAS